MEPPAARGPRLRELGLGIGAFETGEANAITDLKPSAVGKGDLLIPMIAIDGEFGGGGRFLEEHRIRPAPQQADFRLKKN